MENKPANKRVTILVIILMILVAFFVYRYYSNDDESASSGLTVSPVSPEENIIGRDLLKTLLELKSISIDAKFLSDLTFNSLKDFSKALPQEPVGRRNPFSPIGVDGPTTNATSSNLLIGR